MTFKVSPDRVDATLFSVAEEQSSRRFEGDDEALDALFEKTRFVLLEGDTTLYREVEGALQAWSEAEMAWI